MGLTVVLSVTSLSKSVRTNAEEVKDELARASAASMCPEEARGDQ